MTSTTLCLDALATAHVLIVVIIFCVGLFSLLVGLTLTLSQDTWTDHIFPIMAHVPLGPNGEVQRTVKTSSSRMVKYWIPKIYLTESSTSSRPMSHMTRNMETFGGQRHGEHIAHGFWLLETHDQKQEIVLQPHSPVTQGVCDFW
jgi:hypothetical protein